MKVWTEECLVLPPSFTATLLRDASILVQYENLQGNTMNKHFTGELARALQHEMDHDRGILILDHVDLNNMDSLKMKSIETAGHENRMKLAYSRYIDAPYDNPFLEPANALELKEIQQHVSPNTPPKSVGENTKILTDHSDCDEECLSRRKKIIQERRAMMNQSRSNANRRDVLELSRQRAALYGTQYGGL